jgi:outer membrane biosynthesis protein TonB
MEKVAVVATGASVAVSTAAAAAIAHASSNLSVKYGAEEESENTEYENMEENDAAASTDGSYKAPEAPEPEDVKKVKSTGGEDKAVTLTDSFLGMFGIGTTEKKDEEKEEPVNTPPVADDTKEVEGEATKDNKPITLSSQMDDYFNHKFV